MQSLPNDVLEHILRFLHNDGIAVGRLSLCCRSLYQQINDDSDLWHQLIRHRWSMSAHDDSDDDMMGLEDPQIQRHPRQTYLRRHSLDEHTKEILTQMTSDLQQSLQVSDDAVRIDGNQHVGQAWEHFMWRDLLTMRGNIADYLRQEAQVATSTTTTATTTATTNTNVHQENTRTFYVRLRSFLAARSLQTIQFAECLYEWKAIQELQMQNGEDDGRVDHPTNAVMLERYALLINDIQQTPDQLILRHDVNIKQSVQRRLDHLADACREDIHEWEANRSKDATTLDKIAIINEQLFQKENFQGNSEDYYNYRNSLLDSVLDTKKGIPITLAILYTCICRRLELYVHLVGLPGHVVLGFLTDRGEDGELKFLDVFRKGELLTVSDCRRICASYNVPWDDKYLRPLPANQVLQRILNNLANCHFHGLATGNEAFHSDLFFHQRALASIHRQPPGIAAPLVDRVTQELPLTLSPDLLRFYGMLSPSLSRETTQAETGN